MTIPSWRRKTYYEPRVLVDTESVLNNTFPDVLLCLTGEQANMLRNMTQYLHRRSTFAQDLETGYYAAPDESDWDTISALVADLEYKLMGGNCDELIDAIEAQTAVLATMMQCVCQNTAWQAQQATRLPPLEGYVEETLVTYANPEDAWVTPTAPGTDTIKCQYAQAIYLWMLQSYTETLLPFASTTTETLLAALVATVGFGSLATFVGMPVAVLTGIVSVAINWAVDGSIANFTNWLYYAKDEIVCSYYNDLPDYAAAAASVKAFIDTQDELSYLDKALAKGLFGSEWHMRWIVQDQITNSTWDSYFVAGQCAPCFPTPGGCVGIGPCNLDDWDGGSVECVAGAAWHKGGTSVWQGESGIAPSSGYLVVHFIPRSDGYPTPISNFGLTRVSDGQHYNVITGVSHPVDVPVTVYAAIPSILWGNEVYFDATQATYWSQPIYFCLQESPPV